MSHNSLSGAGDGETGTPPISDTDRLRAAGAALAIKSTGLNRVVTREYVRGLYVEDIIIGYEAKVQDLELALGIEQNRFDLARCSPLPEAGTAAAAWLRTVGVPNGLGGISLLEKPTDSNSPGSRRIAETAPAASRAEESAMDKGPNDTTQIRDAPVLAATPQTGALLSWGDGDKIASQSFRYAWFEADGTVTLSNTPPAARSSSEAK